MKTKKLNLKQIFLIILMITANILTLAPYIEHQNEVAAENVQSPETITDQEVLQDFLAETSGYSPDTRVKLIVELSDDAEDYGEQDQGFSLFSLGNIFGHPEEEITTEEAQSQTLDEMQDLGVDFDLENQYDLLLNGFSGTMSIASAKQLANLPQVKNVQLVHEFTSPASWKEPNLYTSAEMVFADFVQDSGYLGLGTVIAILDSGADVQHPDFNLDNIPQDAALPLTVDKIQSVLDEQSLNVEKQFTAADLYRSKKVPFAYNYPKKSLEVYDPADSETGMHGMHVAGIAAANGDPEKGGVRGISPHAQLLIMKVFQDNGTTDEGIYIKAIEDAVKLGANVINLSLGAPAGVAGKADSAMNKAINKARGIGCLVVTAAGNVGTNNYTKGTKATTPDMGIVSSPAVEPDSLAVASMQNIMMYTRPVEMVDVEGNPYIISKPAKEIPLTGIFDQELQLIDCGKANRPEEIPDEVQGKAALIERGGTTFVDKINRVQAKGAVLAIIYNNTDDDNIEMSVKGTSIPSILLTTNDGQRLLQLLHDKQADAKIIIRSEYQSIGPKDAGKMSDFTSWGLTPLGDLKPEITAPGGNIYSTFNDGKYGLMSGTSMATPHISGAVALMNLRFRPEHEMALPPLAQQEARSDLIKNLLMSTADPFVDHWEEGNPVYTSPRQQGAGVLNVKKAMQSYTTVTAKDGRTPGLSKVVLGDMPDDSLHFSLILNNYSHQPVNFKNYRITLVSDFVKDGSFTMHPTLVHSEEVADSYTVPAAQGDLPGMLEVPISVNAAAYQEKLLRLQEQMPSGYFLEGFVEFEAADVSSTPNISIPFVGFRNVEYTWDNLPILEAPIYEYNMPNETPAYYDESLGYDNIHFTHFITYINGDIDGEYKLATDNGEIVLGETTKPGDLHRSFCIDEENPIYLSPNFDGKYEYLWGRMVFHRNYNWFEGYVQDEDGNEITTFWEKREKTGTKDNFYYKNADIPNSWLKKSTEAFLPWHCDANFKQLPDGKYYIGLRGQSLAQRGTDEVQQLSKLYPLIIDTKAPNYTDQCTYDPDTGLISLDFDDGKYGSGVSKVKVFVEDQEIAPVLNGEDFRYQVTPGTNPELIRIEVRDQVFNTRSFFLDEAISNQTVEMANLLVKANLAGQGVYVNTYKLYRLVNGQKVAIPLNISDYPVIVNGHEVLQDMGTYPIGTYVVEIQENVINKKVADMKYYTVNKNNRYTLKENEKYEKEVTLSEVDEYRELVFDFVKTTNMGKALTIESSLKKDEYRGLRHFKATNLETGRVYLSKQAQLSHDDYEFGILPLGKYKIEAIDVQEGWYSVPEFIDYTHSKWIDRVLKIQFARKNENGSIIIHSLAEDEDIDPSLLDQVRYEFKSLDTDSVFQEDANGHLPFGKYSVAPIDIPEEIKCFDDSRIVELTGEFPEASVEFHFTKSTPRARGNLVLQLVDQNGNPLPDDPDIQFRVTYNGTPVEDLSQLPYNPYMVELISEKPGYEILVDPTSPKYHYQRVILDSPEKIVQIPVIKLSEKYHGAAMKIELTPVNGVTVDLNQKISIQVKNSEGTIVWSEQLTAQENRYETTTGSLPADDYRVEIVDTPAEFHVEPNAQEVKLAYTDVPSEPHLVTFTIKAGQAVKYILIPNNGQTANSYFGVVGQNPQLPEPARKYARFLGWYTNEACTTPFNFEEYRDNTQPVTLYAKWDPLRVIPKVPGETPPEGYIEVTFDAGESGFLSSLAAEQKHLYRVKSLSYWVVPNLTTWHDLEAYLPKVTANLGSVFTTWSPQMTAEETLADTTTFTAVYEAVVRAISPDVTDVPQGFVIIRFHADEPGNNRGILEGLTPSGNHEQALDLAYQVAAKALWEELVPYIPQVISNQAPKSVFYTWQPTLPDNDTVVGNLTYREFTARYTEANTIKVVDPNFDLIPEGFKRIIFRNGQENSGKSSLTCFNTLGQIVSNETVYAIDVHEDLTWNDVKPYLPTVQVQDPQSWQVKGWQPAFPGDETHIKDLVSQEFTVLLEEVNPEAPQEIYGPLNPDDPEADKPANEIIDQYWRVTFTTDGNGSIDSKNTYYILKTANKTLAELTKPEFTPQPGYSFDRWDPVDTTPIDQDRTVTAIFTEEVTTSPDYLIDPQGIHTENLPQGVEKDPAQDISDNPENHTTLVPVKVNNQTFTWPLTQPQIQDQNISYGIKGLLYQYGPGVEVKEDDILAAAMLSVDGQELTGQVSAEDLRTANLTLQNLKTNMEAMASVNVAVTYSYTPRNAGTENGEEGTASTGNQISQAQELINRTGGALTGPGVAENSDYAFIHTHLLQIMEPYGLNANIAGVELEPGDTLIKARLVFSDSSQAELQIPYIQAEATEIAEAMPEEELTDPNTKEEAASVEVTTESDQPTVVVESEVTESVEEPPVESSEATTDVTEEASEVASESEDPIANEQPDESAESDDETVESSEGVAALSHIQKLFVVEAAEVPIPEAVDITEASDQYSYPLTLIKEAETVPAEVVPAGAEPPTTTTDETSYTLYVPVLLVHKTNTVSFIGKDGQTYIEQKITTGESFAEAGLTVPTLPDTEHDTFIGWINFNEKTQVTKDLRVRAQFKSKTEPGPTPIPDPQPGDDPSPEPSDNPWPADNGEPNYRPDPSIIYTPQTWQDAPFRLTPQAADQNNRPITQEEATDPVTTEAGHSPTSGASQDRQPTLMVPRTGEERADYGKVCLPFMMLAAILLILRRKMQ